MSPPDLYLAGILEVSGTLSITARKNRSGPRVQLMIQSRRKELPIMFSERFGGAVNWRQVSSGKRWCWQKTGKPAQKVLRTLRPFIRVRGAEFDRLMHIPLRNRGGMRGVHRHSLAASLMGIKHGDAYDRLDRDELHEVGA